jgi:hypothetical protein
MVKALDVFNEARITLNQNKDDCDDKEVVQNHRLLKKEVSDMHEVMERMAKVIAKQNEHNKALE